MDSFPGTNVSDFGLGSWPARRARIAPDAIAFRQADRVLRYRQAAERIDALAAAFAELGVGRGDRVAYLGPNDIATLESFFATNRLGAIFIPLNTRLSGEEIGFMLRDSGTSVLVYGPETEALVAAAEARANGVRELVALDPAPNLPEAFVYDRILAAAPTAPAAVDVGLDDDALILYTSGTTGRPKGAVLTHANLTFNTFNMLAHVDLLGTDVTLCAAPLFHITGLALLCLPTLLKGGTLVLAPRFEPGEILRTIERERVSTLAAVPTIMQMLSDEPGWQEADLSSMRFVIYGGSAMPERVAGDWARRGVECLQGYGMTEAAPGIMLVPPASGREHSSTVGTPHFLTDSQIVDPGGAPIVGEGTGELLVRGPNVFRGYWQLPEETEACFRDGWFRSGDVVRRESDGWGFVVDRVKDMYISGGENVYPAEVEAALEDQPSILAAAVVGVPDERWGEVGLAFVVARSGESVDAETLRAELDGRLARYKIPRYVRLVDELPRTASGKVRREALRTAGSDAVLTGEIA